MLLFEARYLFFLAPLLIGLLLCVGSLLGSGNDGDLHPDVDCDTEVEGHHDHHTHPSGVISWFLYFIGAESVPTGFALAFSFLLFGSAGLLGLLLVEGKFAPLSAFLSAFLLALVSVFVLSRHVCRLFAWLAPIHETHSVTPESLVGRSGTAISYVGKEAPNFGYIGVMDDSNSYHVVKALALIADVPKGTPVMLSGYNQEHQYYTVLTNNDMEV